MQNRLDFFDLLLFALMVSSFVIGIHQSFYHGVAASYWLFMLSILSFLGLNQRLRKKKADPVEEQASGTRKPKKKAGK
jgi:hypothetical protein